MTTFCSYRGLAIVPKHMPHSHHRIRVRFPSAYYQNDLSHFLEWLCRAPKATTYRVNILNSSAVNFKSKLEAIVAKRYENAPKIFHIDGIPEVVCIANIDNIIKCPLIGHKEIMVDTGCGAALLRGAHVFAPGVLSMQSGTKLGELVNVFADLEGTCKKGTNIIFESEQKAFIGTGEVKMQRHHLYGEGVANHGIAIEMHSTVSGVPSIGDLSSGEALLQNFPSIVCVRVLDPQPGETILDMCSAPGNKTTHIAELMRDNGTIIAIDKTEAKAEMVRRKIETYQLKSVKAFAYDSTKVLTEATQKQTDAPPFATETFDRILLDAPCSGLGNRPLLSNKLTPKMLKSYPSLQRKLFRNAVGLLKPNGVLVFSTCSITEDENEGMVKWVIDNYPEMKLIEATPIFGGPGITECSLKNEERYLVQRFGPEGYNRRNELDSIGFFIAKFIKCTK